MNLLDKLESHVGQRVFGWGPPSTRDVVVTRDLRVPMSDGTVLLADRWSARHGGDDQPVALIRSPYGRANFIGKLSALPLAERGYQVLVQSARGTFGSGGTFDAMRQERRDGLDTLNWIAEQPWFSGSIVLIGGSYMGYVQWAVADDMPDTVKAMIPAITESACTMEFLRPDGMSLEAPLGWGVEVDGQERPFGMLRSMIFRGKLHRALRTVPLKDADVVARGHRVPFIQDILVHAADSPRWDGVDHRHRVAKTRAAVSSVAGWYDVFLPGQLADFRELQAVRDDCRLTVGPWTHMQSDGTEIREAMSFGLAHARGERPPSRAPVRLYVMGAEQWRDFDEWPPKGYDAQRFYLQPGGGLSAALPAASRSDTYRYDPNDPTPAVGGIRLSGRGRVENSELEARADVLTYTTADLPEPVEIIGEVSADIWIRSSRPSADVFVRICDVDPRGRSFNVCDGLVTVRDAQQLGCATVRLWPTAYRFRAGHRIRVQVSSGAFPRFARNHGSDEPMATVTTLLPADQAIHHDPDHPSSITVPVKTV